MRMTGLQTLITVAALALGTAATRFLPFVLFPENKKTPPYVLYLGKVLPPAIIALLVVYCLKAVDFTRAPFALPETLAIAFVAAIHLWRRSVLLSIGSGTVFYMVLVQFVFKS